MYPIISENNTGIQNIQKGDHLIGINNEVSFTFSFIVFCLQYDTRSLLSSL